MLALHRRHKSFQKRFFDGDAPACKHNRKERRNNPTIWWLRRGRERQRFSIFDGFGNLAHLDFTMIFPNDFGDFSQRGAEELPALVDAVYAARGAGKASVAIS